MKTLIIYTLFPLFFGCATSNLNYKGKVKFIAEPSDGVVLVSSFGFGKTEANSILDAEENAIQILLFKGFPATKFETPLIPSESKAKNENGLYFEKLFAQKEYKKFVVSTLPKTLPTRIQGGYETEQLIQINHISLKNDLEENKIIRKFGY